MPNTRYAGYGKALFELVGTDPALLKAYQKALLDVSLSLKKNGELQDFLSSYAVNKENQFKVIDELFRDEKLVHLAPFLKLIESKRLFSRFEDIRLSFHELANKALGKEEGIAYSASKLAKEDLEELEKALGESLGKEIELENRVEPSLLGGIRVFVDGKVYDGTIETKLESLRKKLLAVARGGSGK